MALNRQQRRNVKTSLKVANRLNAPRKVKKALLEAERVEANFLNLPYGDRDSQGILQQRPSQGWGPPGSVPVDVAQFVKAAIAANQKGMPARVLAQTVQRSQFPERYGQHAQEATQLLRAFGQGGGQMPDMPGAPQYVRGPSTTKTIPGVDNSRARQLALLDYFMNEQGQPGALIQIAQQLQQLPDIPARTKTVRGKRIKATKSTIPQPQGQGQSNGPSLQLPRRFSPTHQTSGLPGYPARDIFGKPGEPVRAPVSGKVVKLSGRDPSAGAYEGQGGPFGWSVYIQGDNGSTYYLTHFGSRTVKQGQRVKRGQVIGTIGNYPGATPDHIHEGRHS